MDKENRLTLKLFSLKPIPTRPVFRILQALKLLRGRWGGRGKEDPPARTIMAYIRTDCIQNTEGATHHTGSCLGKSTIAAIPTGIATGLLMLTPLLTYAITGYIHDLRVKRLNYEFAMRIHEQAAKVTHLENEVQEYRELMYSFSKKGKRKSLGIFRVTAYDPLESCEPFDDGMTAKLIPAGMGVAAVDPGVIPYGSVLYIPDLDRYFFASDTGIAMKRGNGRNIDILMPTVDHALKFGRRYMEVELIDLSRG